MPSYLILSKIITPIDVEENNVNYKTYFSSFNILKVQNDLSIVKISFKNKYQNRIVIKYFNKRINYG